MNFSKYKQQFIEQAKKADKDDYYIEHCLTYAGQLYSKKLPIIYDIEHFSKLTGIDLDFLIRIVNKQNRFYRFFYIPKRNGSKRKIAEPLPMLKGVQKFILDNLLINIECSDYSKAFRQNYSIRDNAKFHRGQKYLLKIDLKDYFDNLNEKKVYELFNKMGYTTGLCTFLSKLCVLNHSLPQGAPTSPYLSNLLTIDFDNCIYSFCQSKGLRYSRYADDITISGTFKIKEVLPHILKIIKEHDLIVNESKISVVGQHKMQEVTGVVVNSKLQAPKKYRKVIRQEIYYIKKFGLENHINTKNKGKIEEPYKYLQTLIGKINFCLQINKKDEVMINYKTYLINLLKQMN